MPTYNVLTNLTQKGIETVKEGPGWLDAAKEAVKAAGGEYKGFYLTMGRYDFVSIIEAPDDDIAVAGLALAIGLQGTVRTETLRAFTEDEYRRIVATLP